MIDEKKCYLFGRNAQLNDFCLDHASCSRVHSAFVYHKYLNIAYLVDLGSTHGTFIGSLRLEPNKPTQLQLGANFSFGASTRSYILRERPSGTYSLIHEEIPIDDGTLFGLPETQSELDNLTEYNTAHNRRIAMITDDTAYKKKNQKKKRRIVTFNEEEIIINPEDIDPTVGRFRNLIQTTVVPSSSKRSRLDNFSATPPTMETHKPFVTQQPYVYVPSLYQGLSTHGTTVDTSLVQGPFGSKFLILPNPAPEVSISNIVKGPTKEEINKPDMSNEPKKKKYAKEAWPGRKPLMGV